MRKSLIPLFCTLLLSALSFSAAAQIPLGLTSLIPGQTDPVIANVAMNATSKSAEIAIAQMDTITAVMVNMSSRDKAIVLLALLTVQTTEKTPIPSAPVGGGLEATVLFGLTNLFGQTKDVKIAQFNRDVALGQQATVAQLAKYLAPQEP